MNSKRGKTSQIIFAVITGISVFIAYVAGFYLKRGLSDTIRKDEMIKIVRLVQILLILAGIFISLPDTKCMTSWENILTELRLANDYLAVRPVAATISIHKTARIE